MGPIVNLPTLSDATMMFQPTETQGTYRSPSPRPSEMFICSNTLGDEWDQGETKDADPDKLGFVLATRLVGVEQGKEAFATLKDCNLEYMYSIDIVEGESKGGIHGGIEGGYDGAIATRTVHFEGKTLPRSPAAERVTE